MNKQTVAPAKTIFFIFTGIVSLLAVSFPFIQSSAQGKVLEKLRAMTGESALSISGQIDSVLRAIAGVPMDTAITLEKSSQVGEQAIVGYAKAIVESKPEIFGAAIAFEPYGFKSDRLYFSPYAFRKDGKISLSYLGSDMYRYFFWEWYQVPKELDRAVWSEPYYDEGGGDIMMSTFSAPFYKQAGGMRRFAGIVTADISLTWLQKVLAGVKVFRNGYAFLLSRNGLFVSHPEDKYILRESIFSIAETKGDSQLRKIGRGMVRGLKGFGAMKDFSSNKGAYISYAPVPASAWSIGIVAPDSDFSKDVRQAMVRTYAYLSVFLFICGFIIFLFKLKK